MRAILSRVYIDRHVTRFRPITCTDFEMRYNNCGYEHITARWKAIVLVTIFIL